MCRVQILIHNTKIIGIISNIGSAHVERLGTIENIAIAKCEIASNLKEQGLFIGVDSIKIKENLHYNGKKIYTTLNDVKNIEISIEYELPADYTLLYII